MPLNTDYVLYFNIAFFAIIGLGFVVGYIRGFKKSLYSLIVTVVFYGLFFLTIDQVVNQLWSLSVPSLIAQLAPYVPDVAGQSTIGGAVFAILETNLGSQLGDTMSNTHFVAFVTGVSLFALKIVYTILYFTVGYLVYHFITLIIRLIFFNNTQAMDDHKLAKKQVRKMRLKNRDIKRMKKEVKLEYKRMSRKEKHQLAKMQAKRKKQKRKKGFQFDNRELLDHLQKPSRFPLMGAVMGTAKGVVTAFVTLIVLGGLMNMMGSLVALIPEPAATVSHQEVELIYLAHKPAEEVSAPAPMASPFSVPADVEPQLEMARDMINAFNANLFVEYASKVTYTDANYNDEQIPLNLYLFDTVMSFQFEGNKIMFRNELNVISDTATIAMNSDYFQTNNISDISKDEIIQVFDTVSQSKLLTSMLPLGIEIGSSMMDTPVDIPIDELYQIDWESELQTLGSVAAVGFDLLNTAGILTDGADLTTVTLDGSEVRQLFDSLADSELATLGAYVAMEPLLEQAGGDISAIITIPADMDWNAEFQAFGLVAEQVLDTGITMADLESSDPSVIISALSDLDFTVLLNSQIVTNALINVFSGEAGLTGLDMIVVPDDVVWMDVLNSDGSIQTPGELRNILIAINAITDVAGSIDFANFSLSMVADLDTTSIDKIFDSEVLVASISEYLLNMDLGTTPLIIPDSALDANGYITKDEMVAVTNSVSVLVNDLACDEGDTVCEDTGFDINKAFSLPDASIDTLTSSEILGATIGNLVIENGGDILTIPSSAMRTISVDSVNQDVVSNDEIKKLFKAVSVLGFSDLENMSFDPSILNNLGLESDPTTLDETKADTLFASEIVHATLSTMLFDQTTGVDSVLTVPYFAEDGITPIRTTDLTDDIEYISTDELDNILQALLTIDLTDFTEIDSLDLNLIIDNSTILLNSSILQATISKQVLDLGTDTITVPYKDETGNAVRVSVGNVNNATDTEYIKKTEITAMLDALNVLGVSDINNFSGGVDMASITSDPNNIDVLLTSATIHATISQQLLNLDTDGTLSVPYIADDGVSAVRVTVGDVGKETEYISKDEIRAMMDALDILGITDNIDTFDGNVDIASALAEPGNISTLLTSSTIQATISQQLIDLDTAGTVVLPYLEQDDATPVRVTVGTGTTETNYITKSEIENIMNALDILNITTDINSFSGDVDLSVLAVGNNAADVMQSAMIQATVSKQVLDLTTDPSLTAAFVVPYFKDDNATPVRIHVGDPLDNNETNYIDSQELVDLIQGLDILGIIDVTGFTGDIALNEFFDPVNRGILLESSIMQASISKQLLDLGQATLHVPYEDVNTVPVRVTVGNALDLTDTEYVTKDEIGAIFEAFEVLGITDITTFDGTIDISVLNGNEPNQDTLLASASIHATISDILIDLPDAVLIVPEYTQAGEFPGNEVRLNVGPVGLESEFVSKAEIKHLINAFTTMGYTDLNTFGTSIDSGAFFSGRATLLLSSSIQATLSDKMLNGTGGELVVPDNFYGTADPIRIAQTDGVVYIDIDEMNAILDGLEALGLTDFTSMTFDPATIFSADFDTVLASESLQATISSNVLAGASDETVPYGTTTLIVPTYFREGIVVGGAGDTQIEKAELKNLLTALDTLGLGDFGGTIAGGSITTMTDAQLTTMFNSGSIHTTVDNMLRGNGGISVPTLAEENAVYKSNITTVDEIRKFIKAVNTLGQADFSSASFSILAVAGLSAADRGVVADSMITRDTLHSEVKLLADNTFYPYTDADYMNADNTTFFIKTTFLDIIQTVYPAAS